MRNIRRLFITLSAITALGGVLGTHSASATNMFDPQRSNCPTLNCDSTTIKGTVLSDSNFAMPWTVQIGAFRGECLRLDVTKQTVQSVDLEVVLVGPSGTVWRNDNKTPGNLKPLIMVNGTPQYGWYTLQVSQKDGLPVNTDFDLTFGRYLLNNINCLLPEGPIVD